MDEVGSAFTSVTTWEVTFSTDSAAPADHQQIKPIWSMEYLSHGHCEEELLNSLHETSTLF